MAVGIGDEIVLDKAFNSSVGLVPGELREDGARNQGEVRPAADELGTPDAGEIQQIVDQLAHALRGTANSGEVLAPLRINTPGVVFEEDQAESVDAAERGAEIVGNRVAKGF